MDEPFATEAPRHTWVVPLGVTVMVGFGVILYGFSVYATDQAAGGAFSKTSLSLAYGGSVFVGGLLALPIGRFADRRGVRQIIGMGAVLGCLGLVGFSASTEPWQVVATWWVFLGPAQAMIYYEPAYVAIEQWSASPRDRTRTLATITLIGGLAGIVFLPVVAWLVSLLGWRGATALLGLTLLAVGSATSLLFLPRSSARVVRSGEEPASAGLSRSLIRDPRFTLYTLALMLMFLSIQGVIAHRLARFEETGFSVTAVAWWAAAASGMSLPGRWLAPRLAERFGASRIQAIITLIVASSVVLMVDGTARWQMIGHFSLFGLAFGALLPLRAMVMGDWFSGSNYGRIMGAQWGVVVLVGATGPVLVGVLRDATGGYALPSWVVTVLFLASAASIVLSGHGDRSSNR